jgi:ribosomal protein L40E
MPDQESTKPGAELGLCPNCDAHIPFDTVRCPKCSAEFGGTNLWKVKPLPVRTIALEVQEQLELAERYRDRRNWLMLAGVIVAALVGVVLAIATRSEGRSIFMGAVFVGSSVALLIFNRVKPAQCPKCGYKWLFREDRKDKVPPNYPEAELTEWKACPGCGLPMQPSSPEARRSPS